MSGIFKAIGSLFGFGGEEKVPEPKPTPEAPVPDDEESKKRAARSLQRKYATRGRAGTVLSDSGGLG